MHLFVHPAKFTVVVLSLFAGIGGLEHAMETAHLHADHTLIISFETSIACQALLRRTPSRPSTIIVSTAVDHHGKPGSVLALVEQSGQLLMLLLRHYHRAVRWLIVGGSPCQGFSSANPDGRGFFDHRSQLMWVLPVVIGTLARGIQFLDLQSTVNFIIEMVHPRQPRQRQLFDALYQTAAVPIDNSSFGGIARPRLWWLSFDIPLPPTSVRRDPGDFLDPPWRPLWELLEGYSFTRRFGTRLRPCDPGQPAECPLPWRRFPLSMYGINHLVYNPEASPSALRDLKHRAQEHILKAPSDDTRPPRCVPDAITRRVKMASWIHLEGGSSTCRCLSASEVERGMGFPPGSSLPPADIIKGKSKEDIEWHRHELLGNTFAIGPVAHILQSATYIVENTPSPQNPRDLTSLPSTFSEVLQTARDVFNSSLRPLPSNEGR
jgi:hypothetical protein